MRKYIIGGIVGFMLSLGVSAHAEVVDMIGKAVDGTFPVKVGETTLDTPAIVIEGTSYLPVRAISDAISYNVAFDASTGITLTQKDDPIQAQITDLGKRANELFEERRKLAISVISTYESPIGKDENGRDMYKPKDQAYYDAKKQYADMSQELTDINNQIVQLAKQKQAQKQ